MKKLTFLLLFLAVKIGYSQTGVFVPEKLMVQDVVYLKDSAYASNDFIKYPLVQVYESKSKKEILYYLVNNAVNGTHAPLKPSIDEFFPYSVYDNKEEIELNRNGEEINYHNQAIGVSFIEYWSFDAEEFTFEKEVLGYEVITKTAGEYSMYDVPFRVLYPRKEFEFGNNYVHSCHVEYEFLLAPVPFYNREPDDNDVFHEGTSGYFSLPVYNYHGNNYRHAPLLVGYNKKKLVKVIKDKVLNQTVPAYDYYTGKMLNIKELEKVFFTTNTLFTTDANGEYVEEATTNEHELNAFNSVIFIEDWYIHPRSGHLKKKVNGLALVRGYLDYTEKYMETGNREDLKWKKEIVFRINMNE